MQRVSTADSGVLFLRRFLAMDKGERLACLTLVAVFLFNVYRFINL
jgi:hypothetical protein